MTTVSASAPVDSEKERPSFAKIAAAGLKPANAPTNPSIDHDEVSRPGISAVSQDEIAIITPHSGNDQAHLDPRPKRLVQLASQDAKELIVPHSSSTQAQAQRHESAGRRADDPSPDSLMLPNATDDIGTQISSESGSFKPPSLDGKSVASATTFALDEKESLRPDDSASVKAVDDEELFSPPGSGLPGSRIGSDDEVRAFRDQLREISSMEPVRRSAAPQMMGAAPKGVLYIPPQGPGIGVVPNTTHAPTPGGPTGDAPPDPKLLEALDSPRDRIWVLKLEQDIIDFVKDAKESSLNLPQCNSFYRMLAHKIADYYMLGHTVDDSSAAVRLFKTPNCRIPPPLTGITTPSTAASTPPPTAPQMKILRRGITNAAAGTVHGSNMPSKSASENGESSNEEDKKAKFPVSREEREARYEAARLRIMGSAKPSESPEAPKDKQGSRSSSATGKKQRRKIRSDSDDDFDSRSAYSNYYTNTYNTEAMSPNPFSYPEYVESSGGHFAARQYAQGHPSHATQHMPLQTTNNGGAWPNSPYQPVDPTFSWPSQQHGPHDLAADFRAMSFTNQTPLQSPASQPNFNQQQYPQQYYGPQQSWQHPQQYHVAPSPSQHNQGFPQALSPAPGYTMNGLQDSQPYAYGQLPSQAFPGRPPSKLEHPLPGSYKGKHFNPQSQSFIPGNASASSPKPFTPQGPPAANSYFPSAFGPAGQLQRQHSAQAHSVSSSTQTSSPSAPGRVHSQPLTHPLPQPVFPRQPSPNVPLPPKPGQGSQRSSSQQQSPLLTGSFPRQQDQSVIAKWGTPASLPAKPPPSSDVFDASRLPHVTRPSFTSGVGAPKPVNGQPTMPPNPQPVGAAIVNGAGQAGKGA